MAIDWKEICERIVPGLLVKEGAYRILSTDEKGISLERVETGKTVRVTRRMIEKTAERIEAGEFIHRRAIDYTVAKEFIIVLALEPLIEEHTLDTGTRGYRRRGQPIALTPIPESLALIKQVDIVLHGIAELPDDRKKGDTSRRARFLVGWGNAVKVAEGDRDPYSKQTLARIKWDNLGYRIGRVVGAHSKQVMCDVFESVRTTWDGGVIPRQRITLPESIPVEFLERAMERIDREGISPHRASHTYDLVLGERRYAPVVVVAFALEEIKGEPIPPGAIRGGKNTQAFSVLEKAGFEVRPKYFDSTDDHEVLERRVDTILLEDDLGEDHSAGSDRPEKRESQGESYVRCPRVKAKVLRAAAGKCELCAEPAPFKKSNGLPYLEVHHVLRLADGGADKTFNAVALCPNCHAAKTRGV